MTTNSNEYYQDVFYDLESFSINQIRELFSYCLKFAEKSYVDTLDCSKSLARQSSDIPVETIMNSKVFDTAHHVFIHRRGYIDQRCDTPLPVIWSLEIGSRTMESPIDYFIYIILKETELEHIVAKFDLKPRAE